MSSFKISIPDELLPGIIAIATLESKTPEQVASDYAESAARKACQDLKVGPYWEGPIPPQFNADGTPYTAPAAEDNDTSTEAEAKP